MIRALGKQFMWSSAPPGNWASGSALAPKKRLRNIRLERFDLTLPVDSSLSVRSDKANY